MSHDHAQRNLLRHTADLAIEYLESLDRAPVASTATLAELRGRLHKELGDAGVAPSTVIDDLVHDTA